MKRYIIELEGQKIFTYEAEEVGKNFRCRLMKPHGDKFYAAEKYLRYWAWFEAETAIGEVDIFFICPPENLPAVEKLKNAAPKFNRAENLAWQMSELRKFFTEYRDEPLKENFHWMENLRQLIFDDGSTLRIEGLSDFKLSEDVEPVEKIPPSRKFKVQVYSPPAKQENFDVAKKNSEPEKISELENIPETSTSLTELKEKISAEDLQSYIEEQTDGQCDGVSFKK